MTAGEALRALAAHVDARTRRERLLLAAAVVVIVALLWDVTLRAPLAERHAAAAERVARLQSDLAGVEASTRQLRDELDTLTGDGGGRVLEDLRARLERIDEQLAERTLRVISPAQMVTVLREVLSAESGLTLVALRNDGVEPVIAEDRPVLSGEGAEVEARDVPRVFRHRIELVVRGDYFALLDYLKRLEGLRWEFQWDALEIETQDYPVARAAVSLSTLSLAEDWIGV